MDQAKFRDLVLAAIDKQGLTVAEAARRSDVKYDVIRDMKRGQSQAPSVENAKKIAAGLQIPWEDSPPQTIAVVGRVGAGASVDLVDAYEKGDGLYRVACPPQFSPHGIVAVEIEGASMEPIFRHGTVLFYSRNTYGVPSEAINTICVCEDEDGKAWVKVVRVGLQEGTFSLLSVNTDHTPMHGMHLKWAAPVRFNLPPEFVVKVE